MYEKVSTTMDFARREEAILDFWDKNQIFQKSLAHRENAERYTFYDGPPTANGKPHIGHIITRAVKDLIPRYKTMQGYNVLRKAGWDTHGLPVELEVEKSLGIDGKPEIEKYGVEPFIQKCKESVWTYENEWRKMSERVGFWVDMEDPYVTYHNEYIESIWWALKTIHDKELLYKGYKVVPYCPRCGTALSSHEVAQGYKEVTETSVFVKFAVKGQADTYLLAWTTTPWTLPSNVALTVNASVQYVKAKKDGQTFILAAALVETVLGEDWDVTEQCDGAALVGLEYEPLFPYAPATLEKGWYVVADNYVTTSDGTGIVHCAPAFGEDDARVGRINNLPLVQMVNEQGKFIAPTPWEGIFVKDADPAIIAQLAQEGKLVKQQEYTHSYPFCWRCDTPLLYYARSGWFIRMTALRDRLMENNRTVNWLPENIKEGRFGDFLENVVDWALSRERYWGTPLPLWPCDCGHVHAVGSVEQLCREGYMENGAPVPADIELHKPYIDAVMIDCPKCGKSIKRVPEVIDCWFDSGSMPFAQWHFPFENQQKFQSQFPAQFISEAIDQTRGWFYSLLAISTLLFDQSPYQNVIVLGHVQDKLGQKMSKHKGNVVDPWDALNKQGADAVRWYFYTGGAPWLPSRFYEEAVNEGQRRFMGTLWNTYAFYILYADIDSFDPTQYTLSRDLPVMDKWIMSRLHTLIAEVTRHMDSYHITEAGRAIVGFVEELSNWYVRRCRERFWADGMPQDKINAYMTLYTVLETLTRLAAPFTPFMTEAMYQNMVRNADKNAPESVHLCDYPKSDATWIDAELETHMANLTRIVELGRAARNIANRKNRQPLARMLVRWPGLDMPREFVELILDELNVKTLEMVEDARAFTQYNMKPQLRTLGKKYGKLVPAIGEYLRNADGHAVMEVFDKGELLKFEVEGQEVTLEQGDVLVETAQRDGFAAESDQQATVVLDTVLTETLVLEGQMREFVRQLQTARKDAGFEVQDRIRVTVEGDIAGLLEKYGAFVAREVLAERIEMGEGKGYKKVWELDGKEIILWMEKM